MEPWTREVERIYTFSTEQATVNEIDDRTLRDAGFSEEQLREFFSEGFLTRSTEPPSDKAELRDAYFEWMEYLGYDTSDFDWHAWREYMGYE